MADASVLVVDDDQFIRDLVSSALRLAGFATATATTGSAALAAVEADRPDLVVLDVGLPGLDGFEVCRRLRAAGDDTPVVFLTARDAGEDRVTGFARGGDDYVPKPFGIEELVARVRAVLRRTGGAAGRDGSDGRRGGVLRYADLELDEDSLRVRRAGRTLRLSPTELRLLRYLLVNRERVVSKSQILDHVWAYDFDGNAGVVENFISYLRKKVDAGAAPLIHTVRGFGYVLRTEP